MSEGLVVDGKEVDDSELEEEDDEPVGKHEDESDVGGISVLAKRNGLGTNCWAKRERVLSSFLE